MFLPTSIGVPLRVPEVGGPIDPANEAHDLVMSVFGGMSKGAAAVKIRVRAAMSAQAQVEGRFLRLDQWLVSLFEPEHLEETLRTLVGAQASAPPEDPAVAAARREVAEADRKLAPHRAALEAGADPALVADWMRQVQTARAQAEARLLKAVPPPPKLDRDQLAAAIRAAGDMVAVLAERWPAHHR